MSFKNIFNIVFTVLFAVLSLCAFAGHVKKSDVVNVVLLAGQSNMAGHGNYNALSDEDKKRLAAVANRVSVSVRGKKPIPLSFTSSKYQKQKRGFAETFGPELFMGLHLAESYPDQEFLLIKTAHGGTSLYGAWNANWSESSARELEKGKKQTLKLFSVHLENIHKNLTRLRGEAKPYKIIGMAWMQGENDASREVSARTYEANLNNLIAAYRKEFNVKAMPFVIGQINSNYGNFPEGPEMVRSAMFNVAKADTHVGLIATSQTRTWADYPKHDDNVHYNAEGQKRLGLNFAKRMLALAAGE